MDSKTKTRYYGVIIVFSIMMFGLSIMLIVVTINKYGILKNGEIIEGTILIKKNINSRTSAFYIKYKLDSLDENTSVVLINADYYHGDVGDRVKFYYSKESDYGEFESDAGYNFFYWVFVIAVLLFGLLLIVIIKYPEFFIRYGNGEIGASS